MSPPSVLVRVTGVVGGVAVTLSVDVAVGPEVGVSVGLRVGVGVGVAVGVAVGVLVGDAVSVEEVEAYVIDEPPPDVELSVTETTIESFSVE